MLALWLQGKISPFSPALQGSVASFIKHAIAPLGNYTCKHKIPLGVVSLGWFKEILNIEHWNGGVQCATLGRTLLWSHSLWVFCCVSWRTGRSLRLSAFVPLSVKKKTAVVRLVEEPLNSESPRSLRLKSSVILLWKPRHRIEVEVNFVSSCKYGGK